MAREGARGEEKSRIALAACYGFTPSARGFSPLGGVVAAVVAARPNRRKRSRSTSRRERNVDPPSTAPHEPSFGYRRGRRPPPSLSLSLSYFRLGSRVVPSVPRPRNYIPWALGVPRSSTIRAFVVHTSLADEDPMLFHVHILGEQYSRWKCTSRARPSLRPCRSVVQTCTPSNDAIVACQVYGVPAVLSSRARAQSCLEKKWSRSREFFGKHREYRGRNIPRKTRVSRVGIGYFDHAIVQAKTSPKDRE
jgi:hypothetical protein